jgi:hypothetical protein
LETNPSSITRDEVQFSGNCITTLPIDSVLDPGEWSPKPIQSLWEPLLHSLTHAQQRLDRARAAMVEAGTAVPCPLPEARRCGRGFFRVKRGGRLYCSDRCFRLARSAAQSRATAEARAAARAGRICPVCAAPLQAQRSTMLFCSSRCRSAGRRAAKAKGQGTAQIKP